MYSSGAGTHNFVRDAAENREHLLPQESSEHTNLGNRDRQDVLAPERSLHVGLSSLGRTPGNEIFRRRYGTDPVQEGAVVATAVRARIALEGPPLGPASGCRNPGWGTDPGAGTRVGVATGV